MYACVCARTHELAGNSPVRVAARDVAPHAAHYRCVRACVARTHRCNGYTMTRKRPSKYHHDPSHTRERQYLSRSVYQILAIPARFGFTARVGNQLISLLINAFSAGGGVVAEFICLSSRALL